MTENISTESTKEEIADCFLKEFKITEEAKNNLIKEDISGDVLLDISDAQFKSFGIKVGHLMKIKKLLKNNEEKLKSKKEFNERITAKSSTEEVKSFFERCLNFKKESLTLDGKGLIELDEEGTKKLGLNIGQSIKLIKYINYFKTIKEEEPPSNEDIIITEKSTEEDVTKFLSSKCNFSKETIENLGFDAESLLQLDDNMIDEIEELKEEEKEKLKNCLKENKEKSNMQINNKSTEEEVAKYLKLKINFSDKTIKELSLDGESLFSLELKDIDDFTEINEEEKDKLKNLLIQLKRSPSETQPEPEPEPDIVITKDSSTEEVSKFLKIKLKFSESSIKELELDGEGLFLLDSESIDDTSITEEEKKNLKEFLEKCRQNTQQEEEEKQKKRNKNIFWK